MLADSLETGSGFQVVERIFVGLVEMETVFGVGGRNFADKRLQREEHAVH